MKKESITSMKKTLIEENL